MSIVETHSSRELQAAASVSSLVIGQEGYALRQMQQRVREHQSILATRLLTWPGQETELEPNGESQEPEYRTPAPGRVGTLRVRFTPGPAPSALHYEVDEDLPEQDEG